MIPKPYDLSFCFFPLLEFRNCPLEPCLSGLTFAPQASSLLPASTASPAARMLCAALRSRSWTTPHLGQVHSLILNGNLSIMWPQFPQSLELGNQRSILTRVRPYHWHLYSSCLVNSPQAASEILRARLWFLTIFLTGKSSTAIVWFSRTKWVVSLCRKSPLASLIDAWIRATSRHAFSRFREPFYRRERVFWACLNRLYLRLNCLGLTVFSPSLVTIKLVIPASIPMDLLEILHKLGRLGMA